MDVCGAFYIWIHIQKVMAMMVGLFEMAGTEVGEEELLDACQDVMAAIDKDGDGEVELLNLHCQHHHI